MKLFRNTWLILLTIIIIGSLLRLYDIGKVPGSLNWDEVSLGYNAYSILTTGHDEYGSFLPIVLRSFDDYKPALYSYFVIPFIALLGLTEQAVRLPSAVAGITAIFVAYLLICEIIGRQKIPLGKNEINSKYIALLGAFFLAISPWHIQFSRIAFESNVGLTINLLAFLFFMKSFKKNYFLPISFGLAALNIHMYQSERVFSPLLIVFLSLVFYKKLIKFKKWFIISVITALIVALPLVLYILSDSRALMRAKGVSVFSEQTLVERSADKLLVDESTNNSIAKVFDNRRVDFVKAAISGYISHFDLNWLFISGDIARHHAPNMGLLYLFELPFLLVGIYIFIFLGINKYHKAAFLGYFLLVPVPASITSGVPHAVRTLNFVWTWELFIAMGVIAFFVFIKEQKNKVKVYLLRLAALLYLLFAIINFAYYLNQYFVQLNYFTAKDWLFGYKQAVEYVKANHNMYDQVVIENEVPFDQSYMFYLFYMKVDPSYYQKLGGTNSGGFREKHRGFYNLSFEPVMNTLNKKKTLYVGKPQDLTAKNIKKIIKYPDGRDAVAIAD